MLRAFGKEAVVMQDSRKKGQRCLNDNQLVHLLEDSPWEQGIRESGEYERHSIDAACDGARARHELGSWLCKGLKSRSPRIARAA